MTVTAKVYVASKVQVNEGLVKMSFAPDYADPENKKWAVYTPTLYLDMNVLPEVAELFESGSKYTLKLEKDE